MYIKVLAYFWTFPGKYWQLQHILLTSLLAVPVGGIAVEGALQAQCQALRFAPRAGTALWTGLGAIRSTERTGELGVGGRITLYSLRH